VSPDVKVAERLADDVRALERAPLRSGVVVTASGSSRIHLARPRILELRSVRYVVCHQGVPPTLDTTSATASSESVSATIARSHSTITFGAFAGDLGLLARGVPTPFQGQATGLHWPTSTQRGQGCRGVTERRSRREDDEPLMERFEPARVIEVFADVVCPFTHVGLRRLAAYREHMGRGDVAIRVRAWPLELVNEEQVPRALLVEEIAELRHTVAPDLFAGFDPERFPMSSLPALALGAAAYKVDLQHGERVNLALREALFEEGRDLTDPAVLLQIGQPLTLDDLRAGEADVQADYAEGRARGVIGSPHFFVDDEGFFCPTLAIERVEGQLNISFDAEGFDDFMHRCFS